MISKKVKVELVLFITFLGTCFLPAMVLGEFVPPDGGGGSGEIYASSYSTIWGTKIGGGIIDTRTVLHLPNFLKYSFFRNKFKKLSFSFY